MLTLQESRRQAAYKQANELWKSAGILIRGVVTQAITATGGPYAAGDKPGESDCESSSSTRPGWSLDFLQLDHIITWLARTITNTGVEPGSPASVAIPKLQEYTGGHNFDPVIGKYWE